MQDAKQAGKITAVGLELLFQALKAQGYQLIGPKQEQQWITYAEIDGIHDLPQGLTDYQEKGTYRLQQRHDQAYFGYNIGSRSFKQFLFPPREKITALAKEKITTTITPPTAQPLALIGVRACELKAIQIQDKVFLQPPYIEPRYQQRRSSAFIVALNCHTAANTCFCVSMKTGPEVGPGFDLNLSEIITAEDHYFICEVGSPKGQVIFDQLAAQPLDEQDWCKKAAMVQQTAQAMGRKLDNTQIKEKLYAAHDHPHWDQVAQRCLSCTNCTLACPTCFCSRTEEVTDLDQNMITQNRTWDSCFSQEFSYIHSAYVRDSVKSRYRQWLTHKLGSWYDQFDTSGCVGCGRCITWCPVGIDITEEFAILTEQEI